MHHTGWNLSSQTSILGLFEGNSLLTTCLNDLNSSHLSQTFFSKSSYTFQNHKSINHYIKNYRIIKTKLPIYNKTLKIEVKSGVTLAWWFHAEVKLFPEIRKLDPANLLLWIKKKIAAMKALFNINKIIINYLRNIFNVKCMTK